MIRFTVVGVALATVIAVGCSGAKKKATLPSTSPTAAVAINAQTTPSPTVTVTPAATPAGAVTRTATPSPAATPTPAPTQAPAFTRTPTPTATATARDSGDAGIRLCETSQLNLANLDGMGLRAPSFKSVTVSLTNASALGCTIQDYPAITLIGAAGTLPTTVLKGVGDALVSAPPRAFVLPPSATTSFVLEWNSVPAPGSRATTACPAVTAIQVKGVDALPGSPFVPVDLGQTIQPCNGTAGVSPFEPGAGATGARPLTTDELAAQNRCHTGQLRAGLGPAEGAAGTLHQTITLQNLGLAQCTFFGYPGAQMLDAQGKEISTKIVRGGGTASIADAPTHFTLSAPITTAAVMNAGETATFVMEWSDVPTGSELKCPAAAQLEITPPDEVSFLVLNVSGINLAPCNAGTIHVSPVRPPGVRG